MNPHRHMLLMSSVRYAMLFFLLLVCRTTPADTVLPNCFSAPATYAVTASYSMSTNENMTGKLVLISPLIDNSSVLIAQCNCPTSVKSGTTISDNMYVKTPLATGHNSSYGYLTSKLDVHIAVYGNVAGSGNSITSAGMLDIPAYPMSAYASGTSKADSITSNETTDTVCRPGTGPKSGLPARQFAWNAISTKFYLKSPIFGEERFSSVLAAQVGACLYIPAGSGSGCSTATAATDVANIWLSGAISAPLSCTINDGGTIDVDFGSLVSSNFTHQATPPDGFTLKAINITFHCDSTAISNSDKIKLTFSADQGVSDSDSALIAKMVGRDDIGVRIYDTNKNGIRLDGTTEFPITLDSQGNGKINVQAAPVSTTNHGPDGGPFQGDVTVKMDIK